MESVLIAVTQSEKACLAQSTEITSREKIKSKTAERTG